MSNLKLQARENRLRRFGRPRQHRALPKGEILRAFKDRLNEQVRRRQPFNEQFVSTLAKDFNITEQQALEIAARHLQNSARSLKSLEHISPAENIPSIMSNGMLFLPQSRLSMDSTRDKYARLVNHIFETRAPENMSRFRSGSLYFFPSHKFSGVPDHFKKWLPAFMGSHVEIVRAFVNPQRAVVCDNDIKIRAIKEYSENHDRATVRKLADEYWRTAIPLSRFNKRYAPLQLGSDEPPKYVRKDLLSTIKEPTAAHLSRNSRLSNLSVSMNPEILYNGPIKPEKIRLLAVSRSKLTDEEKRTLEALAKASRETTGQPRILVPPERADSSSNQKT